jgi:hypothetical protein
MKPLGIIPDGLKNKIVIRRTDNHVTSVQKAVWQNDWLTARFGDLGNFQIFVDTTPPTINELGIGDTVDLSPVEKIVFFPKDNSGIKNFRALLDDQWLMFTNDKGILWEYIFDKFCPFGVHHLKVAVEDIVGNLTEKSWWFKRYPYTPPPKKTIHKKVKHRAHSKNKKLSHKKR